MTQFLSLRAAPPLPDFVLESISMTPTNPVAGRPVIVTVEVRNQGTAAGDARFLDIWMNRIETSSPVLGDVGDWWSPIGTLAPGETKTITSPPIWVPDEGTNRLCAWIELENFISESNYTNNHLCTTYYAKPLSDEISASDGAYSSRITITWKPVPLATHYRLYRAESFTGTKVPLAGWETKLWFWDETAIPGKLYFYFVQTAVNSDGLYASDFSLFDTGWRLLAAPTGVAASDGPYHGNVTISWQPVLHGSHYAVFRTWPASGEREQISPWQGELVFRDYFALPGATYQYSVRAAADSTGSRPGLFSAVDPGWRMIPPPEGLVASRGSYSDRTVLQWPEAPGAAYYRVYRAETWNGVKTALSIWDKKLWYWDTSGEPGKTYYYFIQAAAGSGGYRPGAMSDPVPGWRSTN